MKRKLLLLPVVCICASAAQAQVKAYAITGTQKGSSNWTEVRLIDVSTGDEMKTIYQRSQDVEKLNARTGKPIVKNEQQMQNVTPQPQVTFFRKDGGQQTVIVRTFEQHIATDAPFATTSAALAYDKKHDRLYYTPMGINELRYIDLKSKTIKVFYFEGEAFGALKGRGDVANQITRMTFGADGKGYALTNSAEHLIQFETDKKPEVKDLGSLTDAPENGQYSVHNMGNYGGDIIADAFGDLYLIGANARVYKIDMKTLVATYKGRIKGLPAGFTTNGAIVEKDGEGSVIVCSSTSTNGYYRFDLGTLQAERVAGENVYNASDLANGNLAYSKKKKPTEAPVNEPEQQPQDPSKTNTTTTTAQKSAPQTVLSEGIISVYPNPVTSGVTKISFKDYANGKYEVQVMDISGKLLSTQSVNISSKLQVEEIKLPQYIAKGSYMIKVVKGDVVVGVNPIIVQ